MERPGKKPNRKEVIAQLQRMYKDRRFASAIKSGKKAKMTYAGWKAATTAERESLHKLIRGGVGRLGTKGTLKKVVPAISILFVVHDINAKGMAGGIANTVFDATPYMGWVKLGSECVWGDWIPDGDSPEGAWGPPPIIVGIFPNFWSW
jgi:hypothetical protein